jgi:hypothetical protein
MRVRIETADVMFDDHLAHCLDRDAGQRRGFGDGYLLVALLTEFLGEVDEHLIEVGPRARAAVPRKRRRFALGCLGQWDWSLFFTVIFTFDFSAKVT